MKHVYKILNKTIAVYSDNRLFMEEFHRDYQWFNQSPENTRHSDIQVDFHDNFLQINHKKIDISNHPTPMHFAFQLVVSEIMSRLDHYYLIHAGVVKMDDCLIILSGPPGIGKSTLVQNLINKGFEFFSDDCAPLHKQSGMIYPFPRSMWIVDQQRTTSIRSKKAIPVKYDSQLYTPLKPSIIICLIDDTAAKLPIQLNLSLKSTDNPLINELKQLPGMTCIRRDPRYPEYRIEYQTSEFLSNSIQAICHTHKQHMWTIYRVPPIRKCFERQAILKKVSVHQAAAEIISEIKMFESCLSPLDDKSPMLSFVNISRHIQNADCYFMTAGNLLSERNLIDRVLNEYHQKQKKIEL